MRLLDLFCGEGGATWGYASAGFAVTGVDIKPQPRHPSCCDPSWHIEFVQADALEYVRQHGHEYDVIHASPPCQAYSRATAWRGKRSDHPDLIALVRTLLVATGKPYVIENVQEARHHLHDPLMLCGTQFGMPVRSHRYFEIVPKPFDLLPPCYHRRGDASRDHGGKQTESAFRAAIGCPWMTVMGARQAIPPCYTKYIGEALLELLGRGQWAERHST